MHFPYSPAYSYETLYDVEADTKEGEHSALFWANGQALHNWILVHVAVLHPQYMAQVDTLFGSGFGRRLNGL